MSAPKINTFSPNPPPGNKNLDLPSNPIPEYPYLPISAVFVIVTAPNKQYFSIGSLLLEPEAPGS